MSTTNVIDAGLTKEEQKTLTEIKVAMNIFYAARHRSQKMQRLLLIEEAIGGVIDAKNPRWGDYRNHLEKHGWAIPQPATPKIGFRRKKYRGNKLPNVGNNAAAIIAKALTVTPCNQGMKALVEAIATKDDVKYAPSTINTMLKFFTTDAEFAWLRAHYGKNYKKKK